MEFTPPIPSFRLGELRKNAWPRPHRSGINTAIGILYEVVFRNAGIVGCVAVTGKVSNMQIRNGDKMKVLRRKLRDQSRQIRKRLLIHCEWAVLLLEIDIEIDDIGRDMIGAQTLCNFHYSRLRRIAVAGLLKPETPDRRKCGCPSQPRICLHDMLWSGSVKHVVIQRT